MRIIRGLMVVLLLVSTGVWAAEAALVTALKGEVEIEDGKGGKTPLQAFVKLHDGDRLQLGNAVRLQITYFQSARQETWQGPGNIEIGAVESRVAMGRLRPQTQQLSLQLAKQLAKTPASDGKGRVVAPRTRSVAPLASLEQVQRAYREMRAKAGSNDHNPELYLLSSYFELKEYDRLRNILGQLDGDFPGDLEIEVLKSLYTRAINNAKMAAK